MKAVVIIDLPDNVKWEEIEDVIVDVWLGEKTFIRKYQSMQRGVKIKPMPNRIDWLDNSYGDWIMYSTGWNACIDKILGEKE